MSRDMKPVAPPGAPTPPLPQKPSIAVLPFANISADPEQEYFSDGITEDIITALSRLRWFFVIARTSTFGYKGQGVDVRQIGRDLGVRYILEGSVRKSGQRLRITSQLLDAITGNHIWSERYDRELTDIFAVQDEVTASVTAAIEPKLLAVEGLRRREAICRRSGRLGPCRPRLVAFLEVHCRRMQHSHHDPKTGGASTTRTTGRRTACWVSQFSCQPQWVGHRPAASGNSRRNLPIELPNWMTAIRGRT